MFKPITPSCMILLLIALSCGLVWQVQATDHARDRALILTDIGNEPDDAQSLVRLLVYANEIEIQGLVATTSNWLRDQVNRQMIDERLDAYAKVLDNLRVHDARYPDADALRSVVRSGRAMFGMSGVGDGMETEASRLIIERVDAEDTRPLWVLVWGGAVDLAQALHDVRKTRTPDEVKRFVAKLRVYSISDQDDAGPWARAMFPELFWIASIHAYNNYWMAAWTGISTMIPGTNNDVVSKAWLTQNIQSKGPLGALYPDVMYAMEGDTPSFLYLIPTGLNQSENPEWGSWGGRYGKLSPTLGLWADSWDVWEQAAQPEQPTPGREHYTEVPSQVPGNKATVARWRPAFQADFAARMDWSVSARFEDANHPPMPVLNGHSGYEPVRIDACPLQPVRLSAAGSSDPDADQLEVHWWHYRDASGGVNPLPAQITRAQGLDTEVILPVAVKPSHNVEIPPRSIYHIILEVRDTGVPALTRYRRAIITVPSSTTPEYQALGCQ